MRKLAASAGATVKAAATSPAISIMPAIQAIPSPSWRFLGNDGFTKIPPAGGLALLREHDA